MGPSEGGAQSGGSVNWMQKKKPTKCPEQHLALGGNGRL